MVEKNSTLQAKLIALRTDYCNGNTAELARRIGKNYSYVHRLFLPQDNKGHKGIGLEIMQACSATFDLPSGYWEAAPATPTHHTNARHLRSRYADLLGDTLDMLGMPEPQKRRAFMAATQLLIDHANGFIETNEPTAPLAAPHTPLPSGAPAPTDAAATPTNPRRSALAPAH